MDSQQIQKPSSDRSPSFDDVSKLFSLPLSEAADILGVSAAVLKKICNDNGLERWPHRKYLAGKSIEEIKKEATRERSKAVTVSPVDRSRNGGSQTNDKVVRSPFEASKLNVQQQHGSRSVFTLRPHQDVFSPSYSIETSTCLDEFKYGFPSDGLSTSSNKWWGGSSSADHDKPESGAILESDNGLVDGIKIELVELAGGQETGSNDASQQPVSISAIRKVALEEGRNALKFGSWKEFGVEKVGKKEKLLLSRIFG